MCALSLASCGRHSWVLAITFRRMHVTCSWPLTLCCSRSCLMSYWLYELLVLACFSWYCDCGGDVDSQDDVVSVCAAQAFDEAALLIVLIWYHMGTCWYRKASVLAIQSDNSLAFFGGHFDPVIPPSLAECSDLGTSFKFVELPLFPSSPLFSHFNLKLSVCRPKISFGCHS